MSDGMIFGMGVVVALVVVAALVPLWWAAMLDGRENK